MRRLFLITVLLLTACASGGHSTKVVKDTVRHGVIESVTPIEMDASSNAGSMAGGLFGQVGGASAGTGRGSVVGSIFGSVLGGTIGHQAGINSRQGMELWVKVDGAEQSTYVMQPGKPEYFKIGDHVRIVQKKGETRVEPDTPQSP